MLLGSMSRAAFSPAQRGTEPPTSVQDRKRAVTPSGPSMSAQLPTLMPTSTASGYASAVLSGSQQLVSSSYETAY